MPKTTPEQLRRNVEKRVEAAAQATPNSDVAKAFRALVGAWDKAYPDTSITFEMPCGSRCRIVCLEDARGRAARTVKKKGAAHV